MFEDDTQWMKHFTAESTDEASLSQGKSYLFWTNERRLWLAVFKEAILEYNHYLVRNRKPKLIKLIDWFFNQHNSRWLGSLENICFELDFDVVKVRRYIIDLTKAAFANNNKTNVKVKEETVMYYTVERALEFDAGHRVLRHGGKCKHLHGHRYKVIFCLESPTINNIGVISDFGDIKTEWGGWLDEKMDHGLLLEKGDPWIDVVTAADATQKIYILPYPATAEGIARHLYETFSLSGNMGKYLTEVKVWETPSCTASYKIK